jgi:hypothetical protein
MRRAWLCALLVATPPAGFSPGAVAGQAPPLPVTVSADLGFRSRYLFAGIPFATGEVVNAKVTVVRGGLTLNAFTNHDVDASDITEADVWGDYYVQLSPLVGAFAGGALYNFKYPTGWEATPELYAGLTLGVPLAPTIYFAHDFDLGDGSHALFSLSHTAPLGEGDATLTAAGNVDYNDDYYLPGSSFAYASLAVSLGIPVGTVTLSPMFLLQQALDEDRFDDFEVGGINVLVAF